MMAARGIGVEHETRTTDLADAAVRVLERDGIAALTFRRVAAEAGVSTGRVQHYFRDSRGLFAATFRRVQILIREQVEQELAAAGRLDSPRAVVAATLHALIPRDERRLADLHVGHQVELQALSDEELAAEIRLGRAGLVDFLAGQLATPVDGSRNSAHPNRSRTALLLLATADGLAAMTLIGQLSFVEAHALLDDALDEARAD